MYRAPSATSDLVYYMHDGPSAFRFRLTGHLSHHTARDLEQARQTAESVIGGKNLLVDLTELTSLDDSGRQLLDTWQTLGARLTVKCAKAQPKVQLMTGRAIALHGKPSAFRWLPLRATALWLAALLALLSPTIANAVAARVIGMGELTSNPARVAHNA